MSAVPFQDRLDHYRDLFERWDDIRPTAECPHCVGTGKAPSDGRTECGFCR